MRAICFESFGDPSDLAPVHLDRPGVGEGEVLVEVHAAAVNHSDAKNVRGMMKGLTKLPCIPGRDFSGVVAEGPADLVGTEVWGTGGELGFVRHGTHAEFVVLPRDAVVAVPRGFTLDDAAAAGLPYVTAWSALREGRGALEDGETLLVVGAAGAVGAAATDLARRRGARVFGAERGADACDAARLLGIDDVVDTAETSIEEGVMALTGGRGVDLVLDTVGGPVFGLAMKALRQEGRIVTITTPAPMAEIDLLHFYRTEIVATGVNTTRLSASACAAILDRLADGFAAGELRAPRIASRSVLDDAAAAYATLEGGVSGRVLLTPVG